MNFDAMKPDTTALQPEILTFRPRHMACQTASTASKGAM